jgi:tRNA A37 threonylcarbamoyladenosine dehydratase
VSSDYETRFGAVGRLLGRQGLDRLREAHVAVVGLGGVGSWAVEALARSGVGTLTLVDLDEVCLSNVNRQVPALDGCIGRFKAEALAERVHAINPACHVVPVVEFFTEANADRLLSHPFSAVVDAIDAVENKCRLIAGCRSRSLPVVVCGAAGGRRDPTGLRVADLSDATHDRLLAEVRRRLRRSYGFAGPERLMDVPCVFSVEQPFVPLPDGSVCPAADAPGSIDRPRRLNCDQGYGSAAFVTGAFGLAAAAVIVDFVTRLAAESGSAG